MRKILTEKFFIRPIRQVGEELLGKALVGEINSQKLARIITEVEIYDGFKDRASHAFRGKTKRNETMFKMGGRWYVYLVYGMHWMLNVVAGEKNYPAAILIRGVEGVFGPGKVAKLFGVDRALNNKKLNEESGLWIEDWGIKILKRQIIKKPRIGIDYAGSVWAKKLFNFSLKQDCKVDRD